MVNKEQNDKKFKLSPIIIVGGILVISVFPAAIPIGIVVFIIYALIKNGKKGENRKKTPLSSAQKSEYKQQPPKQRPPQPPQNRAQTAQPRPATPTMQSKNYSSDRTRFVRTTTDYGARHRENAKRLLDAGLMERDEYNMQIARSRTL